MDTLVSYKLTYQLIKPNNILIKHITQSGGATHVLQSMPWLMNETIHSNAKYFERVFF